MPWEPGPSRAVLPPAAAYRAALRGDPGLAHNGPTSLCEPWSWASSSVMRARSCSFSHSSCRFSSRSRETSMAVSRILASSNSNFSAYMLSPFTPLDRARLLVLVRVRLFGQMLQHGHETVKTLAHLGVLLLEHLPFAFRLHKALRHSSGRTWWSGSSWRRCKVDAIV